MSVLPFISGTFGPDRWREVVGSDLHDLTYYWGTSCGREIDGHPLGEDPPVMRITFDRPDTRNAFRLGTVDELYRCLDRARMTSDVAAVILTGNSPNVKDGGYSFRPGGDQRVRSNDGYRHEVRGVNADADLQTRREQVDPAWVGRLHILEVQRLIRTMPKVVIAAVPGWAAGGDHFLNVVCDLSIVPGEHTAFMQTNANVGSSDAGYGPALSVCQVGDKRACEILSLAGYYDADTVERWGVVNASVPHAQLEDTALEWAKTIVRKLPQAIRFLKFVFNLTDDGMAGQQVFVGETARMAYMTSEVQEGRDVFLKHRKSDWSVHPYYL